jgi:putative heme-binding domain-containing protein
MLLLALLLWQHIAVLDLPTVDRNPFTTAADVEQGKKLYGGRCAGCHGPEGDGGKGANLATPSLAHGDTDLSLYRTIRYGLPETEMPGHNMTQREIWQLSAFVRTLGRAGADSIAGDRTRGATLFKGKGGCLQCHMMSGEGGHMGPALDDIGRRRSPAFIRKKLLDPASDLAGNFSTVQLTTKSGQTLNGFLLNEDTYSVQLRDNRTRMYSFWKQELKDLKVDRRTLMPAYDKRMNSREIDDLVAYLAAAGGTK